MNRSIALGQCAVTALTLHEAHVGDDEKEQGNKIEHPRSLCMKAVTHPKCSDDQGDAGEPHRGRIEDVGDYDLSHAVDISSEVLSHVAPLLGEAGEALRHGGGTS